MNLTQMLAPLDDSDLQEGHTPMTFTNSTEEIDKFLQQRNHEDSLAHGVQDSLKKTDLRYMAGARVSFVASLDSMLSYDLTPPVDCKGTVVSVKSAGVVGTIHQGRVMVAWDSGLFTPVLPRHLELHAGDKRASSHTRRISFVDLGNMFAPTKVANELVHKSTQDLWSFRQDGDTVVIDRMFDDTGSPLKGI